MEKKIQHTERRGLPGGPNEMFTYTTGVFSTEGFRMDSPDVNNEVNIIPSGSITMKERDGSPLRKGPIHGIDNLGNEQVMYPGFDYQFPGTEVTETLIAKMGGALLDKTIECGNCGWKWKAADGGSDLTTCHKCGGEAKIEAQDGKETSWIDYINPKNWGVTDYTNQGTRGQAFAAARKAGEKEFLWNGNRFNTNYAGTPEQQLKETGLTNEQIQDRSYLNKNLTENLFPFSYEDMPQRLWSAGIMGKKEPLREKYTENYSSLFNKRLDALNLYSGIPQKNNTFRVSKYKPSKSAGDDVYYTFNHENPYFIEDLINHAYHKGQDFDKGEKEHLEDELNSVMGHYTMSTGKDEKGNYISFYDKWDLSPADFGKPFHIYDRIYTKDYGDGKQWVNALMADYITESFRSDKKIENFEDQEFKKLDMSPEWGMTYREFLQKLGTEAMREGLHTNVKKMYYSDDELLSLDPNKKNFDILALQKELVNRGYSLPSSTKQYGNLDGTWGDETKKALLDYQTKNKKTANNSDWVSKLPKKTANNKETNWVSKLPKEAKTFKQYWENQKVAYEHGGEIEAQDGKETSWSDYINPMNWGVSDRDDDGTKSQAFRAAKNAGEDEFMWHGTRYTTTMKNLPGERIKERDDFKGNMFSKAASGGKRADHYGDNAMGDAYRYYGGLPLKSNELGISKYIPTTSKDPNARYVSINNEQFLSDMLKYADIAFNDQKREKHNRDVYDRISKVRKIPVEDYNKVVPFKKVYNKKGELIPNTYTFPTGSGTTGDKNSSRALGNMFISKGKDDRGDYYSYYDVFNKDTGKVEKEIGEDWFTKPYEIYDRVYIKDYGDGKKKTMYYSDKELSELDIDKKNFDTLALQRELVNRGYKLPKSTKSDGTFDGTWGDETKQALLDYQTKNKKTANNSDWVSKLPKKTANNKETKTFKQYWENQKVAYEHGGEIEEKYLPEIKTFKPNYKPLPVSFDPVKEKTFLTDYINPMNWDVTKFNTELAPTVEEPVLSKDLIYKQTLEEYKKDLMLQENANKDGWDSKKQLWFPIKAPEKGGGYDIGYGHKILKSQDYSKGLTNKQVEDLLMSDYNTKKTGAEKIFNNQNLDRKWKDLTPQEQILLTDYNYNGVLSEFKKFMEAVSNKDKGAMLKEYVRHQGKVPLGKRNEWTKSYINNKINYEANKKINPYQKISELPTVAKDNTIFVNPYIKFRNGGESIQGPLMQAYNRLPMQKKMGGAIANKKEFGGQLNSGNITMYKDYIKGNIGNEPYAIKNYDKLNRIYYNKAKELGMSAANYIMTHVVGNS